MVGVEIKAHCLMLSGDEIPPFVLAMTRSLRVETFSLNAGAVYDECFGVVSRRRVNNSRVSCLVTPLRHSQ